MLRSLYIDVVAVGIIISAIYFVRSLRGWQAAPKPKTRGKIFFSLGVLCSLCGGIIQAWGHGNWNALYIGVAGVMLGLLLISYGARMAWKQKPILSQVVAQKDVWPPPPTNPSTGKPLPPPG